MMVYSVLNMCMIDSYNNDNNRMQSQKRQLVRAIIRTSFLPLKSLLFRILNFPIANLPFYFFNGLQVHVLTYGYR